MILFIVHSLCVVFSAVGYQGKDRICISVNIYIYIYIYIYMHRVIYVGFDSNEYNKF